MHTMTHYCTLSFVAAWIDCVQLYAEVGRGEARARLAWHGGCRPLAKNFMQATLCNSVQGRRIGTVNQAGNRRRRDDGGGAGTPEESVVGWRVPSGQTQVVDPTSRCWQTKQPPQEAQR